MQQTTAVIKNEGCSKSKISIVRNRKSGVLLRLLFLGLGIQAFQAYMPQLLDRYSGEEGLID